MSKTAASDFNAVIAEQTEAAHQTLAYRWLEQLRQLLPVADEDIFPGERVLDDIPAFVRELAAFLRSPADEAIASNALVTAKATQLGKLRHAQRASVHQVLREYSILRSVFVQFIEEETARLRLTPSASELFALRNRLDVAIEAVLQKTIDSFVTQYTETIRQHTVRLERFSRTVTHELRQPLGVLQFALKLLASEKAWTDRAERERILATAERNIGRMAETLGKLVALSQAAEGADNPLVQQVELSRIAHDVFGQLREMADARAVDLRVVGALPVVTVDVARVELVLVNLVSNAIKYSDPEKPERFVEIGSVPSVRPDVCTVSVRDNGLGIAEAEMQAVFARFYRGHRERDEELGISGMGLGLSIVADCIQALKGGIRVESEPGRGTAFFIELPCPAAS